MEEEKKVQPASEPNPNGENEVKNSDLENEDKGQEQQAEEGKKQEGQKNPEEEGKTAETQKQSREEDAKFAEERRKRKERDEAARKKREEEIRRQAVFEVKSGQVTADELKELGLPKVEDEDQLFLVESLRKAKANGAENPQAEAYQALFKKQSADKAEAAAKKAEEDKVKAIVAEDQKAFKEKFGKTTAEVMKTDTLFMELFGGVIDQEKGNFTELYTGYTKLKAQISNDAKKEGAFPTAANESSKNSETNESNEEFKERYIKTYGHW